MWRKGEEMKNRIFYWSFGLALLMMTGWALAHEKTGWMAPVEANKMKNPVQPTKASIDKGKEVYEKKCASCHGDKGDGKGPASTGLSPKPTNFREFHGKNMTDGEHFWKITTGRGPMPSFKKDLTEEERWQVINYINTFIKQN
jgi:mono/diheme cytochrome c family protein